MLLKLWGSAANYGMAIWQKHKAQRKLQDSGPSMWWQLSKQQRFTPRSRGGPCGGTEIQALFASYGMLQRT